MVIDNFFFFYNNIYNISKNKKNDKDQESIKSSTTQKQKLNIQ